jgi:hypothetical protein
MAINRSRYGTKAKSARKKTVKRAVAKPLPVELAAPPAKPTKKITASEVRRKEAVATLWPDAESFRFNRKVEAGFTTVPRTLALIGSLIKYLTDRADASRVYFDLWCRAYDEGMVEVFDEEELAYSSGFAPSTRHKRSWQDRVNMLQRLGFIAVRPKGVRKIGYILLLHPDSVVLYLRDEDAHHVPDWWWQTYTQRLREIGAKPRTADGLKDFLETANGRIKEA